MLMTLVDLGKVAHHRLIKANVALHRTWAGRQDATHTALMLLMLAGLGHAKHTKADADDARQAFVMLVRLGLGRVAHHRLLKANRGWGNAKHLAADADDARRPWPEGQSTLQLMLMMLALASAEVRGKVW